MQIVSDNVKPRLQNVRTKRIKERYVGEAIDLVNQWRSLYSVKTKLTDGQVVKCNLDQAAEKVGISRKTLEDYYYTLRKIKELQLGTIVVYPKADLEELRDQKMGTIRKLIRRHKSKPISKHKKRRVRTQRIHTQIQKVEKDESTTFVEKLEEEPNVYPTILHTFEELDSYQQKILDMDVFEFIKAD